MGDKKAHDEAQARAREAERNLTQPTAPDPTKDPELIQWQEEAKWFKEGFKVDAAGRNVPATPAVRLFLDYQKEFMIANPGARLVDSVKYAEREVKEAMPHAFKPATPQAQTRTPTVEAGNRTPAVRKAGAVSLEDLKLSRAEQDLLVKAAKNFGIPLNDYIKMYKEG
jgi:hypothetical protein